MKWILFLPALFTWTFSFGIKPDSTYLMTPDSLGIDYLEYNIATFDGASLKTWVLLPNMEDNHSTIVMAYGDGGNMSYWLYHAKAFLDRGFTLVLFDYRGFGKSTPYAYSDSALYDEKSYVDLSSVLSWTRQNIGFSKLGIYALSMGTIPAVEYATKSRLSFMILEGLIVDPIIVADRIEKLKGKGIVLPESAKEHRAKFDRIGTPLMIFAGVNDKVTTVSDTDAIQHNRLTRIVNTFNGDHLGGMYFFTKEQFGDLYIQKIVEFVEPLPNIR